MAEETTQAVPEEETPAVEAETKASEQTETPEAPAAEAKAAAPTPAPARRPAPQRPRSAPRGRQSRRRAKVCQFCVEKIDYIDYKKPELLLPYISPYGKMLSRRRTGVCAKHQRRLAVAIKRARFLALLPYTAEHIRRYGS
jgi:small subunit ribosomal protein S18